MAYLLLLPPQGTQRTHGPGDERAERWVTARWQTTIQGPDPGNVLDGEQGERQAHNLLF